MTQAQGSARFTYADFVLTLLAFQLSEHEKFLAHFLSLFRQLDSNGDGVITNEEFKELYKQMDKSDGLSPVLRDSFQKTVNRLLDLVDPYQCDRITMSDCVKLFSTQKVSEKADPASNETESQFKSMLFAVPTEDSRYAQVPPQLNAKVKLESGEKAGEGTFAPNSHA